MQATTTVAKGPAVPVDARAGKYLTFHLGKEEFGIAVLRVREIMGVQDITAVPEMPPCVKGVLNLRGKVIPVVDLRLKFGMPELEYSQRTCIIVVQVEHHGVPILTGVIVDGVSEVVTFQGGDVEDTPNFGSGVETPYVLGMAKSKGAVKILLDIQQALSSQFVCINLF